MFRSTFNKELLCLDDKFIKVIVCDEITQDIINTGLPYFKFNDTTEILSFINKQISMKITKLILVNDAKKMKDSINFLTNLKLLN